MSPPVVIITGGEGSLATAAVEEFLEHGCEVHRPGHDVLDVASAKSVRSYFEGFSRIDVLVNNAGITGDALFARLDEATWDRVVETNLKGAHLCSQAVARTMMKQRHGHIVHVGSYSARNPPVGQTAYAASKAGLIGLAKSQAKELGSRNIRVNCVLPGFLESRMTARLSDEAKERALAHHALGRFNTLREAARFIHFLTTTEHVSGQVFQLDSRT